MWGDLNKLTTRASPLANPDFLLNVEEITTALSEPILVIGAGGLGCELLKDLALVGFTNIHVIDMDTIDLSNLNRQFLFRVKDIGKPKATTAAEFINNRVKGVKVTPHFSKIEDKNDEFYRQFKLVICGLDSLVARRWANAKVVQLVDYDAKNSPILDTIIPIIDGGTEGFAGHCKVTIPTITPCLECILNVFPPQTTYAMCTLQATPRLPEHCIAWAQIIHWPDVKPFLSPNGAVEKIDTDQPKHMQWLYEAAKARAEEYNIEGVTYKLTQGVVKSIIPAIASTNALISAACATEALKARTAIADNLDNFFFNLGNDGNNLQTVSYEKLENCLVCSLIPRKQTIPPYTLRQFINFLATSENYQIKNPMISLSGGAPIYSKGKIGEENLNEPFNNFVKNGSMILITDPVYPHPVEMVITYDEMTDN